MLWLFTSGWPQVPLILGRPRVSVGDWSVFSCLSTLLNKSVSHFSPLQSRVSAFTVDTTSILVKELRIQKSCPKKIHDMFDWGGSGEYRSSTVLSSLRQEQQASTQHYHQTDSTRKRMSRAGEDKTFIRTGQASVFKLPWVAFVQAGEDVNTYMQVRNQRKCVAVWAAGFGVIPNHTSSGINMWNTSRRWRIYRLM